MSCKVNVLINFVKSCLLKRNISLLVISGLLLFAGLTACTPINLFEKTVVIPGNSWKSSFKPEIRFTITDTSSPYQLYFIIRHTDQYHYNNIYINLKAKGPGSDSAQTARYDIKLGSDETGWKGSGMDDIFEHRVPLTPRSQGSAFYFRKPGEYVFTIEQLMREDPLEYVLNTGIRIEKQQ